MPLAWLSLDRVFFRVAKLRVKKIGKSLHDGNIPITWSFRFDNHEIINSINPRVFSKSVPGCPSSMLELTTQVMSSRRVPY